MHRIWDRCFLSIVCMLCLTCFGNACRGRSSSTASVEPNAMGRDLTVIQVGDRMRLEVYGEALPGGMYRVAEDGTISFPRMGQVMVAGLSVDDANKHITTHLQQYIRDPLVSLFVDEGSTGPVYVHGAVRSPGVYAYAPGMTLLHAILSAGSLAETANESTIFIRRLGVEKPILLKIEGMADARIGTYPLKPRDIVFVEEVF